MFSSAFERKSKCFQMDDSFGVPARCECLQARRGRHAFFIPRLRQGLLPCTRLGVGSRFSGDAGSVIAISITRLSSLGIAYSFASNWPSYSIKTSLAFEINVPRMGALKIPLKQRTILSGNNTKGFSLRENNIKGYSFISSTTSLTI
jgi:hypothetical protein